MDGNTDVFNGMARSLFEILIQENISLIDNDRITFSFPINQSDLHCQTFSTNTVKDAINNAKGLPVIDENKEIIGYISYDEPVFEETKDRLYVMLSIIKQKE